MLRPLLMFVLVNAAVYADSPISALVFDPKVPQLVFAASEITAATGGSIPNFPIAQLADARCAPCVVLRVAPSNAAEQSYTISRLRSSG